MEHEYHLLAPFRGSPKSRINTSAMKKDDDDVMDMVEQFETYEDYLDSQVLVSVSSTYDRSTHSAGGVG